MILIDLMNMINENRNGVNKFGYIKNLIEEYNANNKLITDLQKENYFLAIGHLYEGMDGMNKSYDIVDQKYAIQLIDVLTRRNQEIEKIIDKNE